MFKNIVSVILCLCMVFVIVLFAVSCKKEDPTESPTEAPTQAPTQAPTDAPANPPAEPMEYSNFVWIVLTILCFQIGRVVVKILKKKKK